MPSTAWVSPPSSGAGASRSSRGCARAPSPRAGSPAAAPPPASPAAAAAAERGDEPLALALEQRRVVVQIERRREEVLLRRVLLEAAHEVADGDVELVGAHHRHVQQHVADLARDRLDLPLRHPEQHLELDVSAHAPLPREQPRVRDVEQVVSRDAEPHRARALGLHRGVQAAEVVGIRVDLRAVRRERPAVHDGVDPLHRQVRALDQPHLDGGAPAVHPLLRPRGQAVERRERVGEVRLQDDPRLQDP